MVDSSILKLFFIGSNNEGLRSAAEMVLSSKIELKIELINLPATKGFKLRDGLQIPKKYLLELEIPCSYKGIEFKLIKAPLDSDVKNAALGETEVTQELFEAVMGFNPSKFKDLPDSPQRPVEMVSWFDCIAFCNRLSQELGLAPCYSLLNIKHDEEAIASIEKADVKELKGKNGFRLPTWNEWVLFARADTNSKWPGTSNEREVQNIAWFKDNSDKQTHPVAQKKPNEWGLYDMAGNVDEWVWDQRPAYLRLTLGGCYREDSSYSKIDRNNAISEGHRMESLGFRVSRSIDK